MFIHIAIIIASIIICAICCFWFFSLINFWERKFKSCQPSFKQKAIFVLHLAISMIIGNFSLGIIIGHMIMILDMI
jgi:hypothetical protein